MRGEKTADQEAQAAEIGGISFEVSDAVSYYPEDSEAGYILLCTAKARSSLRIGTHMQTEMRAHREKMGLPAPYA